MKALILALFLSFNVAYSQVLIITHAYNRPDFIDIQSATFKKFMKDDYRFVVFNDAPSKDLDDQIVDACKRNSIECIRIPQEIHSRPYLHRERADKYFEPSVKTSNVIQYSLDTLGFDHPDLVFIIDSDMFLIKDFSIRSFMEGVDLAAVPQSRGHVNYIWNGIVMFNMPNLPNQKRINFNCGSVDGLATDTGGYTHYYLLENPSLHLKDIDYVQNIYSLHGSSVQELQNLGYGSSLINLIKTSENFLMQLFCDGHFLHYHAGGNWTHHPKEFHQQKTKVLNSFLTDLLG